MPDITLPHTFFDTTPADPRDAAEMLCRPQVLPDNLWVVNGQLTEDNLENVDISRELVRRKAYSYGQNAGGTVNMDFFGDLFLRTVDLDVYATVEAAMVPIPGTGISYYLPFDVEVLELSWHIGIIVGGGYEPRTTAIGWSDGSGGYDAGAVLMLWVNGLPVREVSRRIKDGGSTMVDSSDTSVRLRLNLPYGPDHRWWSGSYIIRAADGTDANKAGWHTADVRLALPPILIGGQDPQILRRRVARVKTRQMGYKYLR